MGRHTLGHVEGVWAGTIWCADLGNRVHYTKLVPSMIFLVLWFCLIFLYQQFVELVEITVIIDITGGAACLKKMEVGTKKKKNLAR
jgi:hypothetical protein